MTQRIPDGMGPGHWAELQVREAMERGDFDALSGHGKPLDLGSRRDPNWWINRKLRDEDAAPVPPAIRLKREHDDLVHALVLLPTRAHVIAAVTELNSRIRYANSHGLPGPPSTLMPMDLERHLARWAASTSLRPPPPSPEVPRPAPRRSWWRRLLAPRPDGS